MNFVDYFLKNNDFKFIDAVRASEQPWTLLAGLGPLISSHNEGLREMGMGDLREHAIIENRAIVIERSFITSEPIHLPSHNIYIGAKTFLESGALIKGSCYIGESCEVRQGAYIRGGVIVGDHSVVGHATEVKNAIFMNHTHAGHFAYVGDSILGRHVNLGAGTRLANLQFRTKDEIDTDTIGNIIIPHVDGAVNTGMNKLGSIVGDYSEIGCNSVTAPGSIIAAHTWIYPNTTITKGFYAKGSVIKGQGVDLDRIRRRRPPY